MKEWVVPFNNEQALDELRESFFQGPIKENGLRTLNERTLAQIGPLKVEILSREHPPPHFRVMFEEETANFSISDCKKINGGLDRFYRNIRKWHEKNKQLLIDAWNISRPSDCPVGPYRG